MVAEYSRTQRTSACSTEIISLLSRKPASQARSHSNDRKNRHRTIAAAQTRNRQQSTLIGHTKNSLFYTGKRNGNESHIRRQRRVGKKKLIHVNNLHLSYSLTILGERAVFIKWNFMYVVISACFNKKKVESIDAKLYDAISLIKCYFLLEPQSSSGTPQIRKPIDFQTILP